MITGKQEENDTGDGKVKVIPGAAFNPGLQTTSSSSSWTRLKDPRIVRVSRAFGGKDRHSKVCTVRGLRDRRVRLSVPTAIQLYDLQDRLGLNQPSKVVDWLLDAAKLDIDQLPPLQLPPSIFNPFLHPFPPPANGSASAAPVASQPLLRWDPSGHVFPGVGSSDNPTQRKTTDMRYLTNEFSNVSSQVVLPAGLQQYSFFHPHGAAAAAAPEIDHQLKQMINFQMLMSSTSHPAAFPASLRPPPTVESINHHSLVNKIKNNEFSSS